MSSEEPTATEVMQKVVDALSALQDAQAELVAGRKELADALAAIDDKVDKKIFAWSSCNFGTVNTNPAITLKNRNFAFGGPFPDQTLYGSVHALFGNDSSNAPAGSSGWCCLMQGAVYANGNVINTIYARQNSSENPISAYLQLKCTKDGDCSALIREPAAATNSNQLATCYWTRQRIAAATGKGATTFSLGGATYSLVAGGNAEINPDIIEDACSAVTDDSSFRIFYGFIYDIDGQSWYFTYDLLDQQNFADNAILAGRNEEVSVFARNRAGILNEIVMQSAEFLKLYDYAVRDHKQAIMRESMQRKAQIRAAGNEEEIVALLDDWGLLETYQEKAKAREMANMPEPEAVLPEPGMEPAVMEDVAG